MDKTPENTDAYACTFMVTHIAPLELINSAQCQTQNAHTNFVCVSIN
jgi:hypothetical protein